MIYARFGLFLFGLLVFSFGITVTIKMQHLGIHPWDVLNVGLYNIFGLSIGSWNIIIGMILIAIALILDRSYVKLGTIINVIFIGAFVDFFLWLDFLPGKTNIVFDFIMIMTGVVIMGIGGGLYNAARLGAGPRDGFMLSISDKTGASIGKVRIITETSVLVLGLLIGGPVFIVTFIFTFVQSPIFQYVYVKGDTLMNNLERKVVERRQHSIS
ncbi:MAG TPA: YitT family protein [Pseudogracilibacillus sp.]|nr:YitT family protein [Pseudogracilibacillus sp.]